MKEIVLIKLGGSLITQKDKPFTARNSVIRQFSIEMKKIISKRPDITFLLGNGGGSFAHYPAKKYHIQDKTENPFGYAAVQDGAARLNRIVIGALLENGIAAVSQHPSSFITASKGRKKSFFTETLLGQLQNNLIPVIYGDIVFDQENNYHIFSTESLFSFIIPVLLHKDYLIERIIHLTAVAGVLDEKNQIIPLITQKNSEKVKKHIYKTEGADVTGGMWHKIEQSLSYAKKGIPTYIIQGDSKESLLTKLLLNEQVVGTTIKYNMKG